MPEPMDTQEWVQRQFKGTAIPRGTLPGEDAETRVADMDALRRVPGEDARQFRRENPGADFQDWTRYQTRGGRR